MLKNLIKGENTKYYLKSLGVGFSLAGILEGGIFWFFGVPSSSNLKQAEIYLKEKESKSNEEK